MKKTSVFLTILLVLSLVFAVSCPGEKPSAKITSPVGDDAKITLTTGSAATEKDVVIELINDTFNEEAYTLTEGSKTDLSSWFTSSDAAKATVNAKIKSLEEAAVSKDEEAQKKYVKATVTLSITPVEVTESDKPVTVSFKIPALTGEAKKWTTSGQELSVDNAIEITVEEKKEPSLSLVSPLGGTVWKQIIKTETTETHDLELSLTNAKFNTEIVKEGADVSSWFSVVDTVPNALPILEGVVKEGSTENNVKVSLSVTTNWGGARSGVALVIKIPPTNEEDKKWTDACVELEAESGITISFIQNSAKLDDGYAPSVTFKENDTDARTATIKLLYASYRSDFDYSTIAITKSDDSASDNFECQLSYKSENELEMTVTPKSAVTKDDHDKTYVFEVPEEALSFNSEQMYENSINGKVNIRVE